jgi:hypothetical protein
VFGAAPAFGRHARTREEPTPFTAKERARRTAQFKEARELLTRLPEPGEAVYAVQSGFLDLLTVLIWMLDLAPARCEHLRIATLTWNKRNGQDMLGLLERGKVGRLSLLSSTFHQGHYEELADWFRAELAAYPGSASAVARNHGKLAAFDFADGSGLVVTGSANLRSNRNREIVVVTNDRGLHDYFADWFDGLIRRGDET